MTKPIFLSTAQAYALTNTLNGATLDAYLGGTTTPTAFYSDKTLSTSLGSQLTADSEGRFENAFLPSDIDIKLRLRHTATSTDITFDYAAVDDSTEDSATFKNRLINGNFSINQRQATSCADDVYCFDRWYVLTQSAAVAPSELTDPETGATNAIRLTQSSATPQRIGLAQIIETRSCRDLRSEICAMAGRVRLSTTSTVRYAVLEWTGTADSVTSDIVNDWTSSTYTAGNFFISTTTNVLAVGSVSCTAATWRDLTSLSAQVGAAMNNIIVFVWTESTLAQNGTLDLSLVQFEQGGDASAFEVRPYGLELQLCQRFYRKSYGVPTAPGTSTESGSRQFTGQSTATFAVIASIQFDPPMRTSPTVTAYSTTGASGKARNIDGGADITCSGVGAGDMGCYMQLDGTALVSGQRYGVHYTAVAEL